MDALSHRVHAQHERDCGLSMDALVTILSWNRNGRVGWMLQSPYSLGTRTEIWFGHGCSSHRILLKHKRTSATLRSVQKNRQQMPSRTQSEKKRRMKKSSHKKWICKGTTTFFWKYGQMQYMEQPNCGQCSKIGCKPSVNLILNLPKLPFPEATTLKPSVNLLFEPPFKLLKLPLKPSPLSPPL